MRGFAGLVVLLALVTTSLGAPHQSLAEPPTCPEATPGVALNITFYPNDDDCTKYWVCDNGNLYNCSCPEDLEWNPIVGYCDYSLNICGANKKQPVVSHHQPRAEPPVCPEAIPGVALNIIFYPNKDDRNKYWECDNGNLYNRSCPDGLVWNPNVDSCDWPFNYECPYFKRRGSK